MGGMRCGLSHSGMDAACNAVSMDMSGEGHDMHSGGTPISAVKRNISKRHLGVVFVFQRGRPTIVSVVIWLVFELELRFGDMRGMLECRVQTSAGSICFCLRGLERRSARYQIKIWPCILR
jgi:hypothetical protein